MNQQNISVHASPAANRVGLGRNTNRLAENISGGIFQISQGDHDNIH